MDKLPVIDPRERYHLFQSELIVAWGGAERIVAGLIEANRDQCADIVIDHWIEPIAYCLTIRDKGFSIVDEESSFTRHQIAVKAQVVLFDLNKNALDETKEGKEVADLMMVLHR